MKKYWNWYTFLQVILWFIGLCVLNGASITLLVVNLIDVDITTLTADETYSRTVRYLIKVLKAAYEQNPDPNKEAPYLTYWQLMQGWKAMLVYLFIGIGVVLSGYIIFKNAMRWLTNNKIRLRQKTDDFLTMKKMFILKSKIDKGELSDKDLKDMEKAVD